MRRCALLILGAFWLTAAARAASAQIDDARYQDFNLALARDYLLPRYEALIRATEDQRQAWTTFCSQPSADGFAGLRAAFQAAMDAWIPLQHVRTGPASQDSRIERIYFWPERKSAVSKHVGVLLKTADRTKLEPQNLARDSVAVQGLPALQLLLYDGAESEQLLLAGDGAAAFRCAYGTAVAANLHAIAAEIVDGWRSAIGAGLAGPPRETTQQLFMDLLTLFRLIRDFKLGVPLGKSAEQAKPKLAEGWRSGRSLRNIELNLASARAMYGVDAQSGFRSLMPPSFDDEMIDSRLNGAFDDSFAALAEIPEPLDAAVADSSARPKVQALMDQVRHVRDLLAKQLTPAIGITVGFNALDGD
jgi:hypothetical protein